MCHFSFSVSALGYCDRHFPEFPYILWTKMIKKRKRLAENNNLLLHSSFCLIPGGRVGDQWVLRAGRQREIRAEANTLREYILPSLLFVVLHSVLHRWDLSESVMREIYFHSDCVRNPRAGNLQHDNSELSSWTLHCCCRRKKQNTGLKRKRWPFSSTANMSGGVLAQT